MIVHIGFPKTGTTFLQQSVFVNSNNYKVLDYNQADQFLYRTIFFDELDFDAEKEKKRIKKKYYEENLLISYELLTGPVFLRAGVNRSLIPKRLKKLGTRKVIISIRNQVDLIESLYRQYINQGGTLKPNEVLIFEGEFPDYSHGILIKMFNYYNLVKLYVETFGRENVLVITQERLKKEKDKIVKEISEFISDNSIYEGLRNNRNSKEKNKSLSYFSIIILRFFNRFTNNYFSPKSVFGNFFTSWKIRIFLGRIIDPLGMTKISKGKNFIKNTQYESKIIKYFEASNTKLLSEFGIGF